MGKVLPFAEHKPFDPTIAEAMGVAFDTAWQKLPASGSTPALPSSADKTRKALAMYIIDVAQRGEHDVNRLCDDAIAFVLDAVHLKQA